MERSIQGFSYTLAFIGCEYERFESFALAVFLAFGGSLGATGMKLRLGLIERAPYRSNLGLYMVRSFLKLGP